MGTWGGQGERVSVVCRVVSEDFGRSHLNKDLKEGRLTEMQGEETADAKALRLKNIGPI